MKLKTILLGAAFLNVFVVAPTNIVQAQTQAQAQNICPQKEVIPALKQTKIITQQQFNYRLKIPKNYSAMALGSDALLILDPNSFTTAQCFLKNKVPTEFPDGISVYTKSVNSSKQSLTDLVKQYDPTANNFKTTKVANTTAVTYISSTLGQEKKVSFFTPDKKYLITVSTPYKFAGGVPTTIFNKEVFDKVVSTFSFVRR